MQCMLDSECLEQYPEDGPCIGSDTDALASVKTMEEIEGGWRLYIIYKEFKSLYLALGSVVFLIP